MPDSDIPIAKDSEVPLGGRYGKLDESLACFSRMVLMCLLRSFFSFNPPQIAFKELQCHNYFQNNNKNKSGVGNHLQCGDIA